MPRCSPYLEHRMSRDCRESNLAHCAPQVHQQHENASTARGRVCGAWCVRISCAGLLFAYFPGSPP
ncbi:hypothetical protein XarbCFBP7408_12590 [Xanthomonas arboricola pv. guizotiae]|uniref:Uncharacterized protein n=1 Tax=Xanthomonas arboricola pv. guizotiae TaxID=487867 RepID=A0A2S7A3X6_9XANT|nr:hypothetical protein XarbCFBP7409_08125 [Xanthomonas arboricola pv. guizotiae]PPU23028.1 hypothetical protein XarbCFBP7408_12590 [Xanthomonas arboricola pv. guizotiae]